MQKVRVELPGTAPHGGGTDRAYDRSYDIVIGHDILEDFGRFFNAVKPGRNVAIITNTTVSKLYAPRLVSILEKEGIKPLLIELPDGEQFKNMEWASNILDKLLEQRFDRRATLIALGGGVIGDITGFCASVFLRGIAFVQLPTTIIAQVDSSVGGKTGINHQVGKNLIGAFKQPELVYIDTAVLGTLENREVISGMGEVVKYGIIYDRDFFDYLGRHGQEILNLAPAPLAYTIKRCCEIKAAIVSQDETETTGLRQILNYGHTFGHIVETLSGYGRFRHGEAIGIGMYHAALLARQLGLSNDANVKAQEELISSFGLPVAMPKFDLSKIMQTIMLDKKVTDGEIHFILCSKIGSVFAKKVSGEQVQTFFKGLRTR